MTKVILSFVFTMLCSGLNVDIKNICPRSEKFCVRLKLHPTEIYELDRNVTYLHEDVTFGGSRLYAIPDHIFFVFPKVKFLDMNRCSIRKLQEANFLGADSLQRLEMWKNQIRALPRDVFSGARNLEVLDLSSNRIKELHPACFHGLRRLKKLILFRNDVRRLPPAIFRDLVSLDTIHLEDNYLEALAEDVFAANRRLGVVRIRNNRLKVVHPGIFITMRNLFWLDLSRNFFDEIQTATLDTLFINDGHVRKCFVDGKIRNLFANNNQIDTLFISDLTNTQEMHISNNRINDLRSYSAAKHLLKLDASRNAINVINSLDFAQMPDLRFLNLSATVLDDLKLNTFSGQRNLTVLDLSHNELQSISPDLLSSLNELRELYLDFNQMERLDYERLAIDLPVLEKLGLNGNNWNCAHLMEITEFVDLNGILLANSTFSDSVNWENNVAGINCTVL